MQTRFKLVQKNDPNTVFETDRQEFELGRSEACEIVIKDPHVSRVQARIRLEGNRYYIENLGKNPIQVNGAPTQGQFLNDGDVITLGTMDLWYQATEHTAETPQPIVFDDKTVAMVAAVEPAIGPRLVLSTDAGETKSYPLAKARFIIGRSDDADIYLEDPSVSRRHCLIEQRDDGYYASNLSETNPLLRNDETISESRLYAGDHIRIGSCSLTFISDRPGDAKPAEEKIVTLKKGPGWALWLAAACVLLLVGSFVAYRHVYQPWQVKRNLKSVAEQIAAGNYQAAQDTLKRLLTTDLTPESGRKAGELLSQTALAIAQQLAEGGKLPEAKEYLIGHLKEYGGGKEADLLWEQLDVYRVEIAQSLEAAGKYQAALSQYATVREDSPYYGHAQKGIRRIWLAFQQDQKQHQNLAQLLADADQHFMAKRYLTPVNNNAYSIYQSVLAMDPGNAVALQRIEQMKSFYRKYGEHHFNQKNWRQALTYYERLRFIDPDAPDIQEKISICQEKAETSATKSPASRAKESAPAKSREQVKQLLEESGVESSRIIQFLFEDQSGEKDSEKPW